MTELQTKKCCNENCLFKNIEQPINDFPKNISKNDGYASQCKQCTNEYNKRYRMNNPDSNKEYRNKNLVKSRERSRDYYKKNSKQLNENSRKQRAQFPEKFILIGAKRRAKRDGIEFSLNVEDIVIPEFCPVLKIKLDIKSDRNRKTKRRLSFN